jgi:hypothetical protein
MLLLFVLNLLETLVLDGTVVSHREGVLENPWLLTWVSNGDLRFNLEVLEAFEA